MVDDGRGHHGAFGTSAARQFGTFRECVIDAGPLLS
jgi:hypothetical protein